MRLSQFYCPTVKEVADEGSRNYYWLKRAGYIDRTHSGIYTLLPMALLVEQKIEKIVRRAMADLGAFEILMPALQPLSLWEKSGRTKSMSEILYRCGEDVCLGPTHEEVITELVSRQLSSYQDLPLYVYQIQTKFRRELRPKSGLLRLREFKMKDLYSFHASTDDLNEFYEKVAQSYLDIFKEIGLTVVRTKASGGAFSQEFSDEFQAPCPTGEDEFYWDAKHSRGYNKEISAELDDNIKRLPIVKGIELANIFKLGKSFSNEFNARYRDSTSQQKNMIMGCYGFGITRLIGAIAEIMADEHGLVWPISISPFHIHLLNLSDNISGSNEIYEKICAHGYEVLFDDRQARFSVQLAQADLLGLPWRITLNNDTWTKNTIELKNRQTAKTELMSLDQALKLIKI